MNTGFWKYVCLGLGSVQAALACVEVSASNPATGNQEKVWAHHDGHDYEVKWAERIGGVWSNETGLTDNTVDDTCPALAIESSGATAVVWKQAGSLATIRYRARKSVSGSYRWQSSSLQVSDGTQDASAAWVIFYALRAWVGYQQVDGSGNGTVKACGGDSVDPWPASFNISNMGSASTTSVPGPDLNVHTGHFWVTWSGTSSRLDYREWDATIETWGTTSSITVQNGNWAAAKISAQDDILN